MAEQSELRQQTLQVSGVCLRTLAGGAGEPVLLLHDIDYVNQPQPFQQRLASSFSLTAPDHPGFSASDLPSRFDAVDDLAYLYLGLLRQTGAQHVSGPGSAAGSRRRWRCAATTTDGLRCSIRSASGGDRLARASLRRHSAADFQLGLARRRGRGGRG